MNEPKKKYFGKPIYDRLMKMVDVPENTDECWNFKGSINNAGFGLISGDISLGDPKMITPHRAMARHIGLDIHNNEIQHTCLNKKCVNPKHLVEGTFRSRQDRIIEKHGSYYTKPREKFRTCPHCKETTIWNWFSRKHRFCDGKIFEKYSHLNVKRV